MYLAAVTERATTTWWDDFWASLEGLPALVWVLITIALAVIPIVLTVVHRAADRARFLWTDPVWTEYIHQAGGIRHRVAKVTWSARGNVSAQGVRLDIRAPGRDWRIVKSHPTVVDPGRDFMIHISFATGGVTVSEYGFSRSNSQWPDTVLAGTYSLRLRWFDPRKPSKELTKTWTHEVADKFTVLPTSGD